MQPSWEWIVIILVLVLLFGSKKIPELAQGIGKGIREFKKAMKDSPDDDADSKKIEEKKG